MRRQARLLFGRSFREQFNSGQSLAELNQGLLWHLDSNGSPFLGADQNTFTIGSCSRFVCQKRQSSDRPSVDLIRCGLECVYRLPNGCLG